VKNLEKLVDGRKADILRLRGEEEKLAGKCEHRGNRKRLWKCRPDNLERLQELFEQTDESS
jgi:hypothetical protein